MIIVTQEEIDKMKNTNEFYIHWATMLDNYKVRESRLLNKHNRTLKMDKRLYKIQTKIDKIEKKLKKQEKRIEGHIKMFKERDIRNAESKRLGLLRESKDEEIKQLNDHIHNLSQINNNLATRLVNLENMVYQNEENTKIDRSLEDKGNNSPNGDHS